MATGQRAVDGAIGAMRLSRGPSLPDSCDSSDSWFAADPPVLNLGVIGGGDPGIQTHESVRTNPIRRSSGEC